MTIGAAKRSVMRQIVPYYGKRGMGWANPRKAAYNHLYSMTTVSPVNLVLNAKNLKYTPAPATKPPKTPKDYDDRLKALAIYQRGLKQCEIPMALLDMIMSDPLNESTAHKTIRRLHTYARGYLNKPMSCGFDYCDMCQERLLKLQHIDKNVKETCLRAIEDIRAGTSADALYAILTGNDVPPPAPPQNPIPTKQTTHTPPKSRHRSKKHRKQSKSPAWKILLKVLASLVGLTLAIWLVAEFIFPAILLVLIFLSLLFSKW